MTGLPVRVRRAGSALRWLTAGCGFAVIVAAFAACASENVIIGIVERTEDSGTTLASTVPSAIPSTTPPLLTGPDGSVPLLSPDADVFDAYAGPCLADAACPTGSTCNYDSGVGECIETTGGGAQPPPPPPPPPGG